jgi:membrane dipeptidase
VKRRLLVLLVSACACALLARLPLAGASIEAAAIGVVDLHVDLSYEVNYKGKTLERGSGQYLADQLQRSGVIGVVLPLYIPRYVSPTGPRMVDLEGSYRRMIDLLPNTPPYALPSCAPSARPVRTWFAFEGAAPLAKDPDAITRWVARGLRLVGLVHTYDNVLATSSGPRPQSKRGLTARGREVAERVIRAGALLDVSHASDAATRDIIQISKAAGVPAVATHSDARALSPNPRNLTDALIHGIAQTGGVIGVNFHSPFLVPGRRRARLKDVVREVRYMVKVAGIDHVAIGSDFEGGIRPPLGLRNVTGFPRLARALVASGMARSDVKKIFHENALRVLCPPATH